MRGRLFNLINISNKINITYYTDGCNISNRFLRISGHNVYGEKCLALIPPPTFTAANPAHSISDNWLARVYRRRKSSFVRIQKCEPRNCFHFRYRSQTSSLKPLTLETGAKRICEKLSHFSHQFVHQSTFDSRILVGIFDNISRRIWQVR